MPTPSLDSLTSSALSRRSVLRAVGLGAAGIAAAPILAACTGSSSDSSSGSGSTTVTFGSNASDEVPKKAMAALMTEAKSSAGLTVKINTVTHNDFQNNINNYLKGSPDDVFTWFAGYRMKSYAKQGLLTPIDDVWDKIGDKFSDAFKTASTADDGKKYFVPLYNYPWAFFYRPSVWKAKGYTEPKTLDEFTALCKKMQKDGLTPIAFGDKDGWPAFGTFDYLNMRINGYDFHVNLMAHKESWDSPQVKQVFTTWKSLLPYHASGALGRTWEEAALTVVNKKSGMYLLGSFVGQQFPTGDTDIDFFPFPEINSAHGQDAIEAPIDGFLVSKKGGQNGASAKLMEFLGTGKAEDAYLATDSNDVAAANDASTAKYNALQKKAAKVIGEAKSISQFLDRDAEPAFANNAALPAFQQFIKDQDVNSVCKSLEAQAKQIYGS
jgi:multiple sugar transport system substrate-binding protein